MRRMWMGSMLALVAGSALWWATADGPPKDDPKLFANRVWAERERRDDRDMVLYFVPIEVGSKRVGSITRSSKYAFGGQTFRWTRDGTRVNLELPQTQQTVKMGMRTWSCPNEAPKGFDLCLELTEGKEKIRLYSRKGWRIPKGDDLPIAVAEIPEIPACADCVDGGLEALVR